VQLDEAPGPAADERQAGGQDILALDGAELLRGPGAALAPDQQAPGGDQDAHAPVEGETDAGVARRAWPSCRRFRTASNAHTSRLSDAKVRMPLADRATRAPHQQQRILLGVSSVV
jgi:hypothetical protein